MVMMLLIGRVVLHVLVLGKLLVIDDWIILPSSTGRGLYLTYASISTQVATGTCRYPSFKSSFSSALSITPIMRLFTWASYELW